MTVKVYHTQYRKLERLSKKEANKTQANRYRIVISHNRRLSKTAISRHLGVARSIINRAFQRFDEEGIEGLYDKRHQQEARKVTDEYVELMLSLISDSLRQGELRELRNYGGTTGTTGTGTIQKPCTKTIIEFSCQVMAMFMPQCSFSGAIRRQ